MFFRSTLLPVPDVPKDKKNLPFGHVERNALEHFALAKTLAHIAKRDHAPSFRQRAAQLAAHELADPRESLEARVWVFVAGDDHLAVHDHGDAVGHLVCARHVIGDGNHGSSLFGAQL